MGGEKKKASCSKKEEGTQSAESCTHSIGKCEGEIQAEKLVDVAFNVLTLAFKGENDIDHTDVAPKTCQELGCDVRGRQKGPQRWAVIVCSSSRIYSFFFRLYQRCPGKEQSTSGGDTVAIKESILQEVGWESVEVDGMDARLIKVKAKVKVKLNTVLFVVSYAPTERLNQE